MNLAPKPGGLAYEISPQGLLWKKEAVTETADEALNGPSQGKVDEAKDFLRDLLKDGPVPAEVVYEKVKDETFGKSSVEGEGEEGAWHQV